ncbi:hypothetical protein DPMN_032482 [Dreissena polymorpha]|uniref:Uncharacterized protein n=1 Tax=Dreissena polymorpha TaxID=45954 RepID=A0A9D4M4S5_DREPO|nr:hypothetical protein DPMN_032482 [Dreissena polymorpha]
MHFFSILLICCCFFYHFAKSAFCGQPITVTTGCTDKHNCNCGLKLLVQPEDVAAAMNEVTSFFNAE